MNLIKRLERSLDFWFLLLTSFIFFLLRLPSIFEPYWYGDEGIYQVIGLALREGRILYEGIFDNKPPLLYVLYAIFGSEQDLIRVASVLAGLGAIFSLFFLSKKLFRGKAHENAAYLGTFIFAVLLGSPIFEGNIANAENFIVLPVIAGGLLIFLAIESSKTITKQRLFFISGLLFGVAFLFKIIAVFDFAAFITFLLILRTPNLIKLRNKKFIVDNLRFFAPLIYGFVAPVIATFIYFAVNGAFEIFIRASFFSNIGYVSYGNKFFIPQGFLILKLAVLVSFLWFLYKKKASLPHHLLFILVWLAFSLFNAMFSQRPYTHYLLVLLPSFCLLIGAFVYDKRQRALSLLTIFLLLFIISLNFNFGLKSVDYYKNFVDFVSGNKTLDQYRNFFDRNTPLDYQIADFIKNNTIKSDQVFIWGNNAQVYKLIDKLPPGRYIVAYHMTSYKDGLSNTQEALAKNPPKYIVIMPNVKAFPFNLSDYGERLRIGTIVIYEKVI